MEDFARPERQRSSELCHVWERFITFLSCANGLSAQPPRNNTHLLQQSLVRFAIEMRHEKQEVPRGEVVGVMIH